MNEEDIKRMVRESVKKRIRDEIVSLHSAPQNFQHYHRILTSSLTNNHSYADALLHTETLSSKEVFGIIHESWNEIKNELSLTNTQSEREAVWRDISQYYINETVRQISEINQ